MATMRREPFAEPSQYDLGDGKTLDKGDKDTMNKAGAAGRIHLDQAIKTVRAMPGELTRQVKTNPGATLAAVGAASFVAGAFFGSRIGRLAVTAAIGYGIKTMIDRGLLEEIGKSLKTELAAKLPK